MAQPSPSTSVLPVEPPLSSAAWSCRFHTRYRIGADQLPRCADPKCEHQVCGIDVSHPGLGRIPFYCEHHRAAAKLLWARIRQRRRRAKCARGSTVYDLLLTSERTSSHHVTMTTPQPRRKTGSS